MRTTVLITAACLVCFAGCSSGSTDTTAADPVVETPLTEPSPTETPFSEPSPTETPCATRQEFRKVEPGMTRKQVNEVFGVKGEVASLTESAGSITIGVNYPACGATGQGYATIVFIDGRVYSDDTNSISIA